MIELHIYLQAKPDQEEALERAYREHYVPAITVQKGFVSTHFLKRTTAIRQYEIDIAFQTEQMRLDWVASREHQEAWPCIETLCADVSWQGFDVIA